MPIVATIDGIKIQFYWDEHPPAHFHAEYAEYRASIDIETLEVLRGAIPRAQLRKVIAWARPRERQLFEAWTYCQSDMSPRKIK